MAAKRPHQHGSDMNLQLLPHETAQESCNTPQFGKSPFLVDAILCTSPSVSSGLCIAIWARLPATTVLMSSPPHSLARTGKYNFNADAADFEGVIDAAIADEMDNNTSTSLKI
eukprot:1136971-Pelagomonas_calceolata.AAC.4